MSYSSNQEWFTAADEDDVPKLRKYSYKNIRTLDHDGKSALMHAAGNGAVNAITFLLEEEKDVKGPANWTALMEAVVCNEIRSIELLVPHIEGERLLEKHPKYRSMTTALHIAAQEGNSEAVQLLPTEYDASGWSKMHINAFEYNLGEILENYEQPAEVDILKRSPAFYAVFANPTRNPEFLDERRYTESIHALCRLPNALDQPLDCYGKSPLHYAVEINNIPAIRVLCRYYSMIGTSRACRNYPVNTTSLMIAVLEENVSAAAILAKYEHGARDENGFPAIYMAGQIKDSVVKREMLDILYFREKEVLVKRQLNGKLDVSTFEHNISAEESENLEFSSRIQEDFNSILENITEDNRDEVCEYLCQKITKSHIMSSVTEYTDDLSVSSLVSRNIDTMHEIINGILDVLLEKSVASERLTASTVSLLGDASSYEADVSIPKEGQEEVQELLELNQQLLDENNALKNSVTDVTRKYAELEVSTRSLGVGSFLADAVDSLEFSHQLDDAVEGSRIHEDLQKSQIRLEEPENVEESENSAELLESELDEAEIEIQRLFEENELLKKQQTNKYDIQLGEFSDSALKMSNDLSISSDRQNPFKEQELQDLPSQTESLFSGDRNVFLSLNSVSSTQNPCGELNRKLSDLEMENRELSEDIKINIIMYEERLRELADEIAELTNENSKSEEEINKLIDENVEKTEQTDDLRKTISQYEEEVASNESDIKYINQMLTKLKGDCHLYESEKQLMAEYITDLINDLMEEREAANLNEIQPEKPGVLVENQLLQEELDVELKTAIESKDEAIKKILTLESTIGQEETAISRMETEITAQAERIMNLDSITGMLDMEIKEVVGSVAFKYGFSFDQDIPPIKQLHQIIEELDTLIRESNDKVTNFDRNLNSFIQALEEEGSRLIDSLPQPQSEPCEQPVEVDPVVSKELSGV